MACPAAIAHVRRALPVGTDRIPLTAEQVWRRVGWWTFATITEALGELVQRQEAQITSHPTTANGIGYRICYRARAETVGGHKGKNGGSDGS